MRQVFKIRILGMAVFNICLLGGCLGEKPSVEHEKTTNGSMFPIPEISKTMRDTSKNFDDDLFKPLPNTRWRKTVHDGVLNDLVLFSENRKFIAMMERNVGAGLRIQSTLNRGVSLLGMMFFSDHKMSACDYKTNEECVVEVKFSNTSKFTAPIKMIHLDHLYMLAFYDEEIINDFEHHDQFEVWINFGKEQSHYIFNTKGFSKEFLEFDPDLLKEINSQ
ncbi:hypothetical protein L1281_002583 [Neisseria sp. HSC-16F19]|nr:hypothetical protein [Neisseria sp. HSC-16F19]MCP2041965.1 hypothetical protein [Neisseria sp. HSC-16F19]